MAWIRALNGNILDLPDDLAAILVAQGHEAVEGPEPDADPAPAKHRTK